MKTWIFTSCLLVMSSMSYGIDNQSLQTGVESGLKAIRAIKSSAVDAGSGDHGGTLQFAFTQTVKESGNRFDAKVEEKLILIEKELIKAGGELSDAAELLPDHAGQNLFYKACSTVIGAEIQVARAVKFTLRSKLFEANEFDELSEELSFALDVADCL
ncbi:MAG: hypothetical protein HRU19_03105 [Pseudobacteriovorax sp.]|nr:hypothetical protein [Pseudobacteriovorax sp.]